MTCDGVMAADRRWLVELIDGEDFTRTLSYIRYPRKHVPLDSVQTLDSASLPPPAPAAPPTAPISSIRFDLLGDDITCAVRRNWNAEFQALLGSSELGKARKLYTLVR